MPEEGITEVVALLVFQLGLILIAAKLGAEIAERVRQPAVLGELLVGVAIGPYALGGLPLPLLGRPLFPLHHEVAGVPISTELYALAQIASVLLLFLVGLETDLAQFLRFGPVASVVALGGVVLPFAFGVGVTVFSGRAESAIGPEALFMGAIMTATSVGITARVLSDLRRLDSAEGVTILAGAVVDDVLGILALAIAVGVGASGSVSLGEVGVVGARAIGFWLALTGAAILLARPISRLLLGFRNEGADLALALALALVAAFLAEQFGLALIIGAYSIGLALSQTPVGRQIEPSLRGVYHALVPVFFVVMGMLVNVQAMGGALVFGAAVTILAFLGKLVGCAVPALALGFNRWGAIRIGIGMVPRGEVALIVAGVGLTSGIIEDELFGVAILMTVVTTVVAPMLLVPAFQLGGPGRRREIKLEAAAVRAVAAADAGRRTLQLDQAAAALFVRHLRRQLERSGFQTVLDVHDPEGVDIVEFRRDDGYLTLELHPPSEERVRIDVEYEVPGWRDLVAGAVRDATEEMASEIRTLIATGAESTPRSGDAPEQADRSAGRSSPLPG